MSAFVQIDGVAQEFGIPGICLDKQALGGDDEGMNSLSGVGLQGLEGDGTLQLLLQQIEFVVTETTHQNTLR